MSEKLCLKWNDFQENVNTAFGSLREDKDFTYVTLACEDGHQFEAHKVILVSSSPFFQNLLKRNKHAHPLIFMKGVKSEDLSAVIDFLYCGEANVYQENLDCFLAIAEDLKLRGLVGQNNRVNENEESVFTTAPAVQVKPTSKVKEEQTRTNSIKRDEFVSGEENSIKTLSNERRIAIRDYTSGSFQELDQQVKSMMKQSQNKTSDGSRPAYICQVCGKEGHNSAIRNHIESHHLEGVSLPCNLCKKVFRSRHNLRRQNCEKREEFSILH